MFLGEFVCLGVYGIKLLLQRRNKTNEDPGSPNSQTAQQVQLKTKINPLWLLIPAMFDLVSSTLSITALTMVAASVYQMLRGFSVVIVAGMAKLWVKSKPQYRHHGIALLIIFMGVFCVGLSSTIFAGESSESTDALGIILLFISQIFHGGLFISEEKILGDYYLDPLYVVGMEGFWGLLTYCILLPIL